MKRKIPKKQVIILCGGITAAIILVSLVMLIIRKAGKNDNIAGTKIVEETTVSLDRTTGMEKETTSKETATSTEQVTTERELETTTEKDTTELIITTTNPPTTAKPTEPVTQPVKEVATNPPTTVTNNNNQYRDPYTGDIISKEEYDSIMNEMNNPEPTTTQAPQENVYVFNDDGTINFKKSKIYNAGNTDEEELQFVKLLYKSKEVKNLAGELYFLTTKYTAHWNIFSPRPTFFLCISDEYWILMTFDEDWNIKKGSGDGIVSLYDPDHLPWKEQW